MGVSAFITVSLCSPKLPQFHFFFFRIFSVKMIVNSCSHFVLLDCCFLQSFLCFLRWIRGIDVMSKFFFCQRKLVFLTVVYINNLFNFCLNFSQSLKTDGQFFIFCWVSAKAQGQIIHMVRWVTKERSRIKHCCFLFLTIVSSNHPL